MLYRRHVDPSMPEGRINLIIGSTGLNNNSGHGQIKVNVPIKYMYNMPTAILLTNYRLNNSYIHRHCELERWPNDPITNRDHHQKLI